VLHDKGDLARTNANVGLGFFTNQETGKMFGNKLNLLVTGFDGGALLLRSAPPCALRA
jgi:hypothetical protein